MFPKFYNRTASLPVGAIVQCSGLFCRLWLLTGDDFCFSRTSHGIVCPKLFISAFLYFPKRFKACHRICILCFNLDMSDVHIVKQANIMLYYTPQSYYAQRSGSVSITDNRDSVLRRQRRIKTMFGVWCWHDIISQDWVIVRNGGRGRVPNPWPRRRSCYSDLLLLGSSRVRKLHADKHIRTLQTC